MIGLGMIRQIDNQKHVIPAATCMELYIAPTIYPFGSSTARRFRGEVKFLEASNTVFFQFGFATHIRFCQAS